MSTEHRASTETQSIEIDFVWCQKISSSKVPQDYLQQIWDLMLCFNQSFPFNQFGEFRKVKCFRWAAIEGIFKCIRLAFVFWSACIIQRQNCYLWLFMQNIYNLWTLSLANHKLWPTRERRQQCCHCHHHRPHRHHHHRTKMQRLMSTASMNAMWKCDRATRDSIVLNYRYPGSFNENRCNISKNNIYQKVISFLWHGWGNVCACAVCTLHSALSLSPCLCIR